MSLSSLYISWVDILVLIILGVGVRQGQKRGLSEEILFLAQWFAIIVVAGLGYGLVGRLLASTGFFSLLYSYITAYILIAIAVMFAFSAIRKSVGDKLVASDAFGGGEYFFGMVAGAVKYGAVVIACFCILNARHYSHEERQAKARYQEVNFGTQIFPTVLDLQNEVFGRSFSGRLANTYLSRVMIAPTSASNRSLSRGERVKARERDINEILDK